MVSIPIAACGIAGRWPRFKAMAVSAVLLGLGFGFGGLATSFTLYALSVGIWTLGEIAASAVTPAIIADLAAVNLRNLYQGIFGSAWGLAFFIGPLLGEWVYEQLGAGSLWSGCLALGLLLALGFLAMRAPARHRTEESTLHRFQ